MCDIAYQYNVIDFDSFSYFKSTIAFPKTVTQKILSRKLYISVSLFIFLKIIRILKQWALEIKFKQMVKLPILDSNEFITCGFDS